jgi:hypothetical protein
MDREGKQYGNSKGEPEFENLLKAASDPRRSSHR